MSQDNASLYEGMFLMNQQAIAGDLAGAIAFIQGILERAGAEIVSLGKWDERRLAYPIRGQKRGTYLIALFRVNGAQIANIERDCTLSEEVLRVLVTRADHYGEVEIEQAKKQAEKSGSEARLREEGGRGSGRPKAEREAVGAGVGSDRPTEEEE